MDARYQPGSWPSRAAPRWAGTTWRRPSAGPAGVRCVHP